MRKLWVNNWGHIECFCMVFSSIYFLTHLYIVSFQYIPKQSQQTRFGLRMRILKVICCFCRGQCIIFVNLAPLRSWKEMARLCFSRPCSLESMAISGLPQFKSISNGSNSASNWDPVPIQTLTLPKIPLHASTPLVSKPLCHPCSDHCFPYSSRKDMSNEKNFVVHSNFNEIWFADIWLGRF